MKKIYVLSLFVLVLNSSCKKNNTFIDIGNQTWASENCSSICFQNGDTIYHAKTKNEWVQCSQKKTPAWCYYDFKDENKSNFGIFYRLY